MNIDAINEAAEKYAVINKSIPNDFYEAEILCKKYFKAGALSDTAKYYRFEQFKAEQKQCAEIIACEFAKWHEGLTIEQMVNFETEDGSPYPTFNDAYKYFINNIYTPQKQTIVTDLPDPPWDDSVTHNLELVTIEDKTDKIVKELDYLFEKHIGKMFGKVEAASIEHFLKTGTINGMFRFRLSAMIAEAISLSPDTPAIPSTVLQAGE